MEEKNNNKPIMTEDSFYVMFRKLQAAKKLIARNTIIGGIFGIAVALGVQKTWTSVVVLAPEMASENSLGGSVGSLASMVGINLGASGTDAIYPELYPQIIESTPFIVGLLGVPVTSLDGSIHTSYYDYLKNFQTFSWVDYPIIWGKRLMRKLLDKIKDNPFKGNSDTIDPFYLSRDQFSLIEGVRKGAVGAFVNKSDQIITISVTTQDPLISATLADSVRVRLQEEITAYRTKKARHDMLYYEKLVEESRAEYKKLEYEYATYTDTHQNPFLASVKAKQADLENQMNIAYTVYSQMIQQYEAAKAKVQERTPSFTILQPASISIKPSSTPKIVVAFGWIFLFFMMTSLWILVRDTLKEWKEKLLAE